MIESYLKAIVLAVIEGLTEFIPVSSTGHMILAGSYIDFTGTKESTYMIFIQLGAILAVTLIYKDKFLGLIPSFKKDGNILKNIFKGDSSPTPLHILIAIFPIMLAGFLCRDIIKTQLFSPFTVSIGLIIGGILMIITERLPIPKTVDKVEQISYKQALWIGLGQCLAIWPGTSRSGSTMVAGLLSGVKHKATADFSFIIAVPVMVAAISYELFQSWKNLTLGDLPYFSFGFLISFIVGWVSVKWFLKILKRTQLLPFGIYRIILGCFALYVFYG